MSRLPRIAALLAFGLPAACTVPEEGQLYGPSTASVEIQRNALLECSDKLGYAGQTYALNTRYTARSLGDSTYKISMIPHGRINADAASRINACAEQLMTDRFGSGRPHVGPEDVVPYAKTAATGATGQYSAPAPADTLPTVSGASQPMAGCTRRSSVMIGGSAYCVRN